MNFKKLNSLIDKKKITKASIIKKTGISRPALDSILGGNDFKVSNLEKIARALSVTVGYFFDEEIIQSKTAGRDFVERGKIVHSGPEYNGPMELPRNEPQNNTDKSLEEENAELKRKLIEAQDKIIKLMEKRESSIN